MVIIINDQKIASGKTTLAKEFLKGKSYLELNNMGVFLSRFWCHGIPEFVLIDGASELDIEIANNLTQEKRLYFSVKFSNEKIIMPVPNFILITNRELKIKVI